MVSGADCCSSYSFYVFYGKANGEFEERVRFDMEFELPKGFRGPGKSETRPFIVDWNQDGANDIVIYNDGSIQLNDKQSDYSAEDFAHQPFLLVNTTWDDGSNEEAAKFEFVDLGPNNPFRHDSDFNSGEEEARFHLAFVDHDTDGVVDMLFSVSNRESEVRRIPGGDSDGKIYFMRNLAKSTTPEFSDPKVVFDSQGKEQIGWLATLDFDNDAISEVAFATEAGIQLLKRKHAATE